MKFPYAAGKQSLSKTKACKSCPQAAGMIIHDPNHHGLFLNHPRSSSWLYPNSRDRLNMYMAMVRRNCAAGYRPSHNPASDAPTAGASLEVKPLERRGFRWRKGFALSVRRLARRRRKKRWRRRWKRRIRESEDDSLRLPELYHAVLTLGLFDC
jgi:hypothetical protein